MNSLIRFSRNFLPTARVGCDIALLEHVGFEVLEFGFAGFDLRSNAAVPRAVTLLHEFSQPSVFADGVGDLEAAREGIQAADVRRWQAGQKFVCDGLKYANIEDGWMGIAFIETCVKSSAKKGAWAAMPKKI